MRSVLAPFVESLRRGWLCRFRVPGPVMLQPIERTRLALATSSIGMPEQPDAVLGVDSARWPILEAATLWTKTRIDNLYSQIV